MTQVLFVALACGLAGHRLWRIGAKDSITDGARAWLERKSAYRPESDRQTSRAWNWLLTLVLCAWCSGWWITGAAIAWTAWALEMDWRLALLAWPIASTVTGFVARLDERTE